MIRFDKPNNHVQIDINIAHYEFRSQVFRTWNIQPLAKVNQWLIVE